MVFHHLEMHGNPIFVRHLVGPRSQFYPVEEEALGDLADLPAKADEGERQVPVFASRRIDVIAPHLFYIVLSH